MKKTVFSVSLVILLIFSCKEGKQSPVRVKTDQKVETVKEEVKDKNDSIEASEKKIPSAPKKKQGLFFLEDLKGKYPSEEKIFNNKTLSKRLKNIRRLNYDLLVQNWNNETPISIENHIVHSSGCKAKNCVESAFELFIDLKNDNINVYHFANNTLRVYTEKGFIDLPPGFSAEMEVKKEHAKIGSTTDDIESTYDINLKPEK